MWLLPLSYADLRDYQSQNAVFSSLGGYTSPRIVTWQHRVVRNGCSGSW